MTPATRERSTFSSGLGTVLATAGVAIGLGNVWRFPYMMGKYGGVVFLIAYLAIMVAFGLPALMVEWSLGRHTRRGTWGAFRQVVMPGGVWCSGLLIVTVTMAASYYGVVLAWVLYFAAAYASSPWTTALPPTFAALEQNLVAQATCVLVTIGLACAGLYFGVKRGIERVSTLALPLFFLLFAVLIVRVLTLDGALEGLRAFVVPRWHHFRGTTALAAMGQAFFSLALGGTFMVVYGSYMRSSQNIPTTAVLTASADVGAALMAGLIVVPAAIALGIPLSAGVPLMFEVMPSVFDKIPGGALWGAMFFLSVFLVGMLSLMAAYEVLIAAGQDARGWSRRRMVAAILLIELLLAVPAMLSARYVELSDLIWGSTMQPVGAVMAVVAMAWFAGRARLLAELRSGGGLPVPDWLFAWVRYVIPPAIVVMLVYGWVDALWDAK